MQESLGKLVVSPHVTELKTNTDYRVHAVDSGVLVLD